MLIIPAIDLEQGCVVRLVQGRKDKKIYSRDPLKTARHWAKQGAKLIHVIDLDGASCGAPKNLSIVKDILKSVSVPVQLGGGMRKIDSIAKALELGVFRVVLGTKAAEDPEFLLKVFKKFKQKVIVSIDSLNDKVLIKGWRTGARGIKTMDFARRLKKIGFQEIIYTNIIKDGTLKGPDIKGIKSLLKESGLQIIASGGVSSLNDLSRLKLLEKAGVTGVIVGKALYEGRFTLTAALKYS